MVFFMPRHEKSPTGMCRILGLLPPLSPPLGVEEGCHTTGKHHTTLGDFPCPGMHFHGKSASEVCCLPGVITPLLDPHGVPLRNTGAGQCMKGCIGGSAMGYGGGYNGWSAQGVDWGCEMGCFCTTPL